MKRKIFTFVALISLVFVACNKDGDITIDLPEEDDPNSSGSTVALNYTVIEYMPAPGQYINEVANGSSKITSASSAASYAEDRFKKGLYVSLGAWGGYITIKFNNPVLNSGGYDFSVSSNSFETSNEAGIVWVMQDSNGNGIADDTWYELKGSAFGEAGYERNYWVTYYRPEAKGNTRWEDSNGETGYVNWLGNFHNQDFYYPDWLEEETYTLYGSRLPSQAELTPQNIWVNNPFKWGYADNLGEDYIRDGNRNQFKISDAINEDNQPVSLNSIDFVKVQTAINNWNSLLGENSTEVCGFFTE